MRHIHYFLKRCTLTVFLVVLFCFGSRAFTIDTLMHAGILTHNKIEIGNTARSIVSYGDFIYIAYADTLGNGVVTKLSLDGTVLGSTTVISDLVPDGHHKLSIAIDTHGYLHVVGDMHVHGGVWNDSDSTWYPRPYNDQDPFGVPRKKHSWQYYRSDKPESIESFTFYGDKTPAEGGIPGIYVTYPYFASDRTGTIFVGFRHRITQPTPEKSTDNNQVDGTFAGGIARYDADTQRWTMLGGTDFYTDINALLGSDGLINDPMCMAWHEQGRGTSGYTTYQSLNPFIDFDKNNCMHVVFAVYTEKSASVSYGGLGTTHLLYANSPDQGDTWYDAAGNRISTLPLSIYSTGAVVAHEVPSPENYWQRGTAWVDADSSGNPLLFVQGQNRNTNPRYYSLKYITWNGSDWNTPQTLFISPGLAFDEMAADLNGNFFTVEHNGDDYLYHSGDYGTAWDSTLLHTHFTFVTAFDRDFFNATGILRFLTLRNDLMYIYTLDFGYQSPAPYVYPDEGAYNDSVHVHMYMPKGATGYYRLSQTGKWIQASETDTIISITSDAEFQYYMDATAIRGTVSDTLSRTYTIHNSVAAERLHKATAMQKLAVLHNGRRLHTVRTVSGTELHIQWVTPAGRILKAESARSSNPVVTIPSVSGIMLLRIQNEEQNSITHVIAAR